jgi:hypothetical protein
MTIEAMKQALEAFEKHGHAWLHHEKQYADAITSLRQAIEQAEKQEPVAWRHEQFYEGASGWFYADWHPEGLNPPSAQLLYATPQPQREFVGLTDEEIDKTSWGFAEYEGFQHGAHWAQTKLKEKNT